jgi:hypothetical protein
MSRRKIDPDRLRECAARGMTMADAARELGVSVPGVFYAARREGVVFPSHREAMARPEVKARRAEATREAMARPEVKARYAEAMARPEVKARRAEAMARPEVKARHAEATREAMARPEVKARRAEAMARPEVKARHAEATREAMARPEAKARHAEALARPEVKAKMAAAARARWADPRFNRLAALTPEEREDYDIMKRVGGQRPDDALRAIGRADLIREAAE